MNYKHIQLPLSKADARSLRAGDACLLTGPVYTLRDAGHIRLLDEIREKKLKTLPYGLTGQVIFYAGPTPPKAGRPFGAIGPTTSSRMDFAAPLLMSMGLTGTIGKGERSDDVKKGLQGIFFSLFQWPTAALQRFLAKCVVGEKRLPMTIWGTEALRQHRCGRSSSVRRDRHLGHEHLLA